MDNQSNQTVVTFSLDRVGAKKFARATTSGVGKRLAIILDGKVISAPNIVEPIGGGAGQITGDFSFQSASDLALLLRSGALPAPMKIIEERTVGPSLGKENIELGMKSILIGFALVVLFMAIYYKVFGIAANISLIINLVLITGIMSLLGASLTLPGMAGIVLTVGMAVDANVLIFSRIREELKEKDPQTAIRDGFSRAFVTIFDANVTTLIAALILYIIGTGPVKGFAITLSIGIVTSMFTAIMCTRAIVNLVYGNKNIKVLPI